MMNKFKSLSDSSTSESEDDHTKRNNSSFDSWGGAKRTRSNDDTEDEHPADAFYKAAMQCTKFKSPNKYAERRFSTDDTEDELSEPSSKKFKGDFKNPAQYIERELSTDQTDSESDDKSTVVKGSHNMPSMEVLNGNYGLGMKLMAKMGYKSGTGLGKYEQGRVNIVEASKQRGRRGLGLTIDGLEPSDAVWDASQDEMVSVKEELEWIPCDDIKPLSITELRSYITEGPKQKSITEETEFCEPEIIEKIITYKSVFDKLEPEEMRKARTRSNPFETLRNAIFLNRAALKMANIDTMFDFMFTNPKKMDGTSAVENNELLYFADICAGPGGFSEYILWRRKWECKGFGFTLRNENDFKLEEFFSGPPETFEPYYGVKEDGNIFDPKNLLSFRKFVKENTDEKGVHFVMADGGFSVEGMENEQEILSKRLYLCQFQCALSILRPDGNFVCKLFDIFTNFSVGLIYLMCMAFEKVCIFKPNTSRPANSERYIVCKWLKNNSKDISDYLFEVNELLEKYLNSENDVREVVPLQILKENKSFCEYIYESNNKLGTRQIIHLDKIRVFAKNVELHESKQSDFRKQCLEFWKVPDEARTAPPKVDPTFMYKNIMKGEVLSYIGTQPEALTEAKMKDLKQIFDFHCVVCGETGKDLPPTLFLSLGKSNIYRLDSRGEWSKIEAVLELPAETLFYGELVSELKGESRAQRKITALHIIDAIRLGGKDVRKHHYEYRMKLAKKLAKAVSKPSKSNYAPIRVKKVFQLKNVEEVFDSLAMKYPKNSPVPRLCFDVEHGRHIIPSGLMIFKTTSDPWITAYSKTNRRTYLFNTKKNVSSFDRKEEACANFKSCYSGRIFWSWERGVRLIDEQSVDIRDSAAIHGRTMKEFVGREMRKFTGKPF